MSENKNNYTPAITTTEIADWENRFKENVSPLVQFSMENGKTSMKLYNGISGIEASWAGTIILKADNYIKWSFSLMNEPFIESKYNLNEDSKRIMDSLYDFYNVWKEEWSKTLSVPPSSKQNTDANAGGPPQQIKESRTSESIIDNHSERMRILAGLI